MISKDLLARFAVWLLILPVLSTFAGPGAAAVFSVDSTSAVGDTAPGDGICRSIDTQDCTLRAAIEEANALPGLDHVVFSSALPLDPDGYARIAPATPLIVTDPLEIDGRTAPNFDATPEIPQPIVHLTGGGLPHDGLKFTAGAGGSTVHALAIVDFGGSGIHVESGTGWLIQGCHIGLEGGHLVLGNQGDGIEFGLMARGGVVGADFDPMVGFHGAGNVIVGNRSTSTRVARGLALGGGGHRAAGNRIGTTPDGRASQIGGIPTGNQTGVMVSDDLGETSELGYARMLASGSEVSLGNVISANGGGVFVSSPAVLRSNFVGTSIDGDAGDGSLGNRHDGVVLHDADASLIEDNVVSGNGNCGIRAGGHPTGATFVGNRIGVTGDATAALANGDCGIGVPSGHFEGNWIGGNAGSGIVIIGNDAPGPGPMTTFVGNWIGTNEAGADLGNGGHGIHLIGDNTHTIGGATPGDANTIGFNATGIHMDPSAGVLRVEGSYIGTDVDGRNLGNSGPGLSIAIGASIGGALPGEGNVIGFNSVGIVVAGGSLSVPSTVEIVGNWIGTDAFGRDLGNLGVGIDLVSLPLSLSAPLGVQVGAGLDTLAANVASHANHIYNNGGVGVRVGQSLPPLAPAVENVIRGNAIRDNGGLAIDLHAPGPGSNDFLDIDEGTNLGMNHPVLGPAPAEFDPYDGTISTEYVLDTGTRFPVTVDFYASTTSGTEEWIGSDRFENGDVGRTLSVVLDAPTTGIPYQVRATATDVDGNTSEYGEPIALPEPATTLALVIGGAAVVCLRGRGHGDAPRGLRMQ